MAPYFKAVIPSLVILSLVSGCGPSQVSIPSDPPLGIITPSPTGAGYDHEGRPQTYSEMDVSENTESGQLEETRDSSIYDFWDFFEEYQVGNNPVPPDMTMLEICLYTSLMNVNCRAGDTIEFPVISIIMSREQATLLSVNPTFTHGKFELVNMSKCGIPLGLMNGPTDPVNMYQVSVDDPPLPRVSPNNNQPKQKHVHQNWARMLVWQLVENG